MAGIDTMHVGMLGGYYPEGESEEEERVDERI
jgi:hypothetical protein